MHSVVADTEIAPSHLHSFQLGWRFLVKLAPFSSPDVCTLDTQPQDAEREVGEWGIPLVFSPHRATTLHVRDWSPD